MKLKGKKLEPPKPVDIVIPRGDEVLHFKALAVLDFDEFDKACPAPVPPMTARPGQKPKADHNDSDYKKALVEHFNKRQAWIFIKSLSATPGLEWETLDLADSTTWAHKTLIDELKSSGFTVMEMGHLIQEVRRANSMDESHIEEARNRFLQQEAAQSA